MKFRIFDNTLVIRLDIGDEICESVRACCEQNAVKLGSVSGIGVTKNAVVGMYDLEKKEFISNEINSFMEIAALTGNVSTMNGKTYVHLHAVLCDEKGKAVGGHLKSGVIGATCEIFVNIAEGGIPRVFDNKTGLNILDI